MLFPAAIALGFDPQTKAEIDELIAFVQTSDVRFIRNGQEYSGAGKMLFQQDFKANGNSFCLRGHCAFSNATRETMTRLLDQIADACASDAFAALFSEPRVRPEM